jgi:RNA-directed DNA polymerase
MLNRDIASAKQLPLPFATRRAVEASVGAPDTSPPGHNDERLMERVVERANLFAALARVKTNGGSPGIDGLTVDALPTYLHFLQSCQHAGRVFDEHSANTTATWVW